MPFCIENQGQNLHKSPWLWSSILQTFEGIYAYNIGKKNRIRFPLDLVALFGQVSIWKSYFERCPIARHKWYLFTLAKVDMVKYCYVQMLKVIWNKLSFELPLCSGNVYFLFLSKIRDKHWWWYPNGKKIPQPKGKNHIWRWQFFAKSNFARIEKDHPWPLCTILNNNKVANCPQNNCATWMKAKTRFAWEKQNTTSAFYQICESSNCKKRKAEWQW